MREVMPVMRRQKSGNVINVTSIAARHGGGGGAILYAGAKGFVSTVTHGWAKEVVGDGIRVNAVSPGVITTPFHDRYSNAEQLKAMQATIPMNRLGSADECAGTFLYLASDALSRLRDGAGDRGQRRAVHAVSQVRSRLAARGVRPADSRPAKLELTLRACRNGATRVRAHGCRPGLPTSGIRIDLEPDSEPPSHGQLRQRRQERAAAADRGDRPARRHG